MSTLLVLEQKVADFCEYVGQEANGVVSTSVSRLLDGNTMLLAVSLEVSKAQEVQVGRVVPLVRQRSRHRNSAAKANAGAGFIEGEVGDSNDGVFPDAQSLLKCLGGFFNLLQCLVKDYVVEAVVRVLAKARVYVLLVHAKPLRYASADGFDVQLYALPANLTLPCEEREQFAVSAAQIQRRSPITYPLGKYSLFKVAHCFGLLFH